MKDIKEKALSFVGQKERPGNTGFYDDAFEKKMKGVGWYPGAPWCAFFTRLVWKLCGQDYKLMTGSAVRTYKALEGSLLYSKTTEPVVGALAVWRNYKNGKPLSTGHIGIVIEVSPESFKTVEGNTNSEGGREGDSVAIKTRTYSWTRPNGLRLLGFINPLEISK